MLHRRGIHLRADAQQQRVAVRAHVAEDTDLDELVRRERDVDLVQHGGRQPMLADDHDRMQRVGPGAQRAAFGGGERVHGAHSTARVPDALVRRRRAGQSGVPANPAR